jgi:hypothetical protein
MKNIIIYYYKNYINNLILALFLTSILVACSLSDITSVDLNNSKINDKTYKSVKCPTFLIPKETYKSTLVNKSNQLKLSIKKVEVICKKINNKNENKLLVDYKLIIKSYANYNINYNNVKLPQIYLAIIDNRNEIVLTKILSKTNFSGTFKANKNHNIINKGKFKIIHNNELLSEINIYIGFQKALSQ